MKLQALGRYRLDGEVLGKGNFARVELATHSVLNAKVAIKIIDVDKVKEDYVRRNLGREVKVLSRLRHPNIVRLYETMMSGHLYCLVMEYAPGGDLCSLVKAQREGRFPEGRARPFCRQLVSALSYMHGRGIIHRDLKMENIMLNAAKDTLKIVDFGLSNCWSPESPLKSHCGSPEYAAPELFVVGRTYGPEIDVWSMGVVFYVLLVGRLPFLSSKQEGLTRQERRDRLISHINQGLGGTHRSDMKHLGSECRRLLMKVLEPVPARRLTLRHVIVHPWLTHKGLSPLASYQHPRVGNRQHSSAVRHMSEVLSIKPQLIEERVLKQMYDDIAGMYNILTGSAEVLQVTRLPQEARIRPLELRTPAKRPLAGGSESGSPLRPPPTPSAKQAVTSASVRSGLSSAAARSDVSELRSDAVAPAAARAERPRPALRRPAHFARPTTAPPAKPPTAAATAAATSTAASLAAAGSVDGGRGREPAAAPGARRRGGPSEGRESQRDATPRLSQPAAAPSTSSSSERAWGSPRQRDDRRHIYADGSWDTPRRHNLTDDQKVRTDDRFGAARRDDKSLLLASAAEDEFSSLYDDASDGSSVGDEPMRVVIRTRASEAAGSVGSGAGGRLKPALRPAGLRRPSTAAPDERDARPATVVVARLDEPRPHPPARKSPSESQRRDLPSPRGQTQRRRSALPLAKSPLKHTSSAHAWLSAPSASRGSGSWSSHDRLDFSAGREGRHQRGHQGAAPELKAGRREAEAQTAAGAWRDPPARHSRSEMLKLMVQRQDLVPAATPHSKKKPLAPSRLYGTAEKHGSHEDDSVTSAETGSGPRCRQRPQTAAVASSSLLRPRTRLLRPSIVTAQDRGRTEAAARARHTPV